MLPPATLDPPSWLDPVGREHWGELAPVLSAAGILTAGDRHMLALLCDAFSRFQADPRDDKARDLYRRISVEFGLTPSSRSRIKAAPPELNEDDAWANVLARPFYFTRP